MRRTNLLLLCLGFVLPIARVGCFLARRSKIPSCALEGRNMVDLKQVSSALTQSLAAGSANH